ncbi:MAG: helix-turn-helix domain-containing protein, partial [Ignavibacteriaceae bacterium]
MKSAKKNNPTILKKLSDIENLLKKKDDRPLNFKEACAYLGFAPSYLYKLTYRKVIPHYKPTGKVLFFSKNELDEWIFDKKKDKSRKTNVEESEEETEEDPS